MKKILITSLFSFLFSCSHYAVDQSSVAQRSRSSEVSNQCQTSIISYFPEEEHIMCSWAQDYLRQLSTDKVSLSMTYSNQSESEKRKIITLSAQLPKKEIELILGRGGLRIRYLRYMLNELSYHQTLNRTTDEQKKDVIQNFPLVELILEPQD